MVRRTGEKADAWRSGKPFMSSGSKKVDMECGEGAGPVSDGLGGIKEYKSAIIMGNLCKLRDILNAARDIGGVAENHQLCGGLPERLSEVVGVRQPGSGCKREMPHSDPAGFPEMLEGTENGVVIEFGGDDVVTGLEEPEEDGIEAGSAACGEENGFGRWCLEEFGEC
jgi:hypothetical protein